MRVSYHLYVLFLGFSALLSFIVCMTAVDWTELRGVDDIAFVLALFMPWTFLVMIALRVYDAWNILHRRLLAQETLLELHQKRKVEYKVMRGAGIGVVVWTLVWVVITFVQTRNWIQRGLSLTAIIVAVIFACLGALRAWFVDCCFQRQRCLLPCSSLEDPCVLCGLTEATESTVKITCCDQIFHFECVSSWLKIRSSCPTCWTELTI
jgi:hypothetical protein